MPVTGVEGQIANALQWYLGQAAAAMNLPVAYSNVPFTPQNGEPYLQASLRPNITNALSLGFAGTVDRQGLMQVSVFWPAGAGEVLPAQAAAQVVQAFKYGTRIERGDVLVRIDQSPRVAPALQEDDWLQIPVMIAWRCLVKAAA